MGKTHESRGNEKLVLLGRLLGRHVCGRALPAGQEWDPLGVPAMGLWDELSDDTLSQDERELANSLLSGSSRRRIDRIVERRIERSLRTAFQIQAGAGGWAVPSSLQAVLIRAEADQSADVAGMEPGEPIDALIDQIIAQGHAGNSKSESADGLDFRVEFDGIEVNLLEGSEAEVASMRAGIDALAHHMSLVLDLENDIGHVDELEERDLSGVLLGGKYRVKRLKGKGGFGNVYEAVDEMLGARVALKVLNRRAEKSHGAIENFLREAKLLTSIDHENIVRWITFDRTEDGLHYFVMEYLGGAELEEILQQEGRIEPKRAAEILLRILGALRAAHRLDGGELLHLDLKPENVFVLPGIEDDGAERVKVIDFGISQHVGAEARQVSPPSHGAASSVVDEDPSQTISASVSLEVSRLDEEHGVTRVRGGTLLYSSPEQIEHLAGHESIRRLDGRSDLYSLGVMAYRMLTSRFPFEKCDTAISVINNHLKIAPTPLAATGNRIPRKLAAFVDRCLAKEPDDRWKDSAEAFEFLDEFVHPKSRVAKVFGLAAMSLIAAFALFLFLKEPPALDLALLEPLLGGPAQTISLGVGSPPHELTWEKWPADMDARQLVLVGADGVALAGWTLNWAEGSDHRVSIAVDIDEPPSATGGNLQAYASVLSAEGTQRVLSRPFNLEYLGVWTIDANPSVIDYDGERVLDPMDRVLELVLRGSTSGLKSIAEIEMSAHGEVLVRTPGPAPVADGISIFRIPLNALGALSGETELTFVATDDSGRTVNGTKRLLLAGEPATLDPGRTGIRRSAGTGEPITPTKGRYSVDPECELAIATTTLAEVTVSVIPEGESEAAALGGPYELEPNGLQIVTLASLGLDTNQAEFSGRLVVRLSEESFVDRRNAKDVVEEYAFDFYPRTPELTVSLAAASTSENATPLVESERAYFGWSGSTLMTVERSDQARSLFVDALVEKQIDGSWARAPELPPGHIGEASGDRATEFAFDLPSAGLYRIHVRAFDEIEGERGPEVGRLREFEVVLDTEAPKLIPTLTGTTQGGLITRDSTPELELIVDDASGLERLSWRLSGPSGSLPMEELTANEDVPGSWSVSEWPQLWSGDLALSDGDYSLELSSTDLAGNSGSMVVNWSLAVSPPEVHLVTPVRINGADGTLQWPSAGVWSVSAVVQDANAIETVAVRILNLRTNAEHELPMQRIEDSNTYEIPPGERPRLNPRWSRDTVRIEISAADAGGNQFRLEEEARLPTIEKVFHALIASTTENSDVMIFVPGNERFEYIAGGRKSEGQRTTRWEVPIARGSLNPFYLDRDEVSRATYLRFVLDPDGYASDRWWYPQPAPTRERRMKLTERLQAATSGPVTGVTWQEANAFARYHGKRLPTLVEWEFAVRGGEEYREHSVGDRSLDRESADSIQSGVGTGLRNLMHGVREWSSTPGSLYDRARHPRQHFGTHAAWLLRTPECVASADLDGDGIEDHVAALYLDNRLEVWFSSTGRTEQLGSAKLTPAPCGVFCKDVNGDGQVDLASFLQNGQTAEFLNADGQFSDKRMRYASSAVGAEHGSFQYRWVVGTSRSATESSFLDRSQHGGSEALDDIGFRCALDADLALDLEERQLWKAWR